MLISMNRAKGPAGGSEEKAARAERRAALVGTHSAGMLTII